VLADCWYTATGQLPSGLAAVLLSPIRTTDESTNTEMHGLSGYPLIGTLVVGTLRIEGDRRPR
jgi:hypothetical protein